MWFSCFASPLCFVYFLEGETVRGAFYIATEVVTQLLFFWHFGLHFSSGSRFSFILNIQHLSVIFKERQDIWCCFQLIYFLILQISGINSLFKYQHIEEIRCVQRGFISELLNSRTVGGERKIFDKNLIVNWMKKTKKHNSQRPRDQLLKDTILCLSSGLWSAHLHDKLQNMS